MSAVLPAFAIVRPRVRLKRTGDVHLLDEVIAEFAESYSSGVIAITGGPGSGKSTALAHLAAAFSHNEHLIFLDEPAPSELQHHRDRGLVIAATSRSLNGGTELMLQPWNTDDLIEYLLAVHHDDCGSVIARLGSASKRSWCPQLASVVLDEFAADYELHDASDALMVRMRQLLPDPKQQQAVAEYCFETLTGVPKAIAKAESKLAKAKCAAEALTLLRHPLVQLPLAASCVLGSIHRGYFAELERQLPFELIEIVAWQCSANPRAMTELRKILALRRGGAAQAMAASILLVAEPTWQPEHPRRPWCFSNGIFRGAAWNSINLFRAALDHADFSNAALNSANMENANLDDANFTDAALREAKLFRCHATKCCFAGADLTAAKITAATLAEADFTNANLSRAQLMMSDLHGADFSTAVLQATDLASADLRGANFTETNCTAANFTRANLSSVDLRTACLHGACFEQAILLDAQLEDVYLAHAKFQNANLTNAHLTGSVFPAADLRGANLKGAGLAEIDWEEADLRGADISRASFHMGSSRSGLVNSPYACEGSKTGFYTDDYEDLNFKRPEEIRKANLRGANLSDVTADGVDFYLVDLRDATLSPSLREQARATGAILRDAVE